MKPGEIDLDQLQREIESIFAENTGSGSRGKKMMADTDDALESLRGLDAAAMSGGKLGQGESAAAMSQFKSPAKTDNPFKTPETGAALSTPDTASAASKMAAMDKYASELSNDDMGDTQGLLSKKKKKAY